jgi:HK97 family phage prohead protease
MEHLTVKAVATATDLGWFTAIAAVFGNVDRDSDRIVKGAFAQSIEAWQSTGRNMPLHWNHSADPDDIVGHVDPRSMVETDRGLVVEGQLDLEGSERARRAWRAMKTGSIGLSFGYLTQTQRKAADGANELLVIDLFEVSLTPAPANADTRVLGMKSVDEVAEVPTGVELRRWAERLGVIEPDPVFDQVRIEARGHMFATLGVDDTGRDELREKCDAIAQELKHLKPIRLAIFEVE